MLMAIRLSRAPTVADRIDNNVIPLSTWLLAHVRHTMSSFDVHGWG
jgi:hypothetical protein